MDDDIVKALETLPEGVEARPYLQRLGRYCSTEFMLEAGNTSFHILVDRGHVTAVLPGPRRMRAWAFALRATPQAWRRFWQPVPEVGFSDIFAMARFGHMRIEGDVGPLLQHLRFIKDVLALPRGAIAGENP